MTVNSLLIPNMSSSSILIHGAYKKKQNFLLFAKSSFFSSSSEHLCTSNMHQPNNNPNPNPNPNPDLESEPEPFASFQAFFRRWLVRQEEVHQQLSRACERNCDETTPEREVRLRQLIGRVMTHYVDYYQAKRRVVREDALTLFSPPWFTLFERSLLWIGGFKPGLALRVATNTLPDMTEEQRRRVEQLREETTAGERELGAELTRLQMRPAAISLIGLMRGQVNGERQELEQEIETVKMMMEMLVEYADNLRCETVLKLMEILNTYQIIKFLLAMTQLQLRVRHWGLQREAEIHNQTHQGRH